MSITSAFNASRSGLAATSRWAEITSTNIANAHQPGYARRTVERSTGETGEVLVTGIQREVDGALDRMYRRELARTAREQAVADGLAAYTGWLGDTDNAAGLSARLTALQTSFDMLGNAPGDTVMQRNVLVAAESLALTLNQADQGLRDAMGEAQDGIRQDVATLNSGLKVLAQLNEAIFTEPEGTVRRAGLEDQMATILDQMAEIADITIRRDVQGRVAVATAGGTSLLDGNLVRELAWDPTTGTLTAGDTDITPDRAAARGFGDGRLAGRVALATVVLPGMQLQLDEMARALIQGFEAADGSLPPGQAGLFTDAGAAWSGSVTGLAGSIAVNDAVKPEQGGALWRMREGVGATAEGPPGDSTQVMAFVGMLDGSHGFDPLAGQGPSRTLKDYAAGVVAAQQNVRVMAQTRQEELVQGLTAIESSRQSLQGVNIDDELQILSQIEQAYNANSQVLRTLSEMIDTLLAAV